MIQRGRREARPLPSAVAQCRSAVAQCRSERGLHVDDVACEVGRKTEKTLVASERKRKFFIN